MSLKTRPLLLAACLGLTLQACAAVGPDYSAPALETPPDYSAELPQPTGAATPLERWWGSFDDPTLGRLVLAGIDGNIDLRIAESRVREAQALLRQADARRSPEITGVAGADLGAREGLSPSSGASSDGGFDGGFRASWEADLFGGVDRAVEAAEAGTQAAEERRRAALVALSAEIGDSYIALRGGQQRLIIARQLLATQEDTLGLVEQRAQFGLANQLEVARARSAVDSLRADIPRIEADLRLSANRLAVLLGESPGEVDALLDEAEPVPQVTASPDPGLPADLLRRRPDLRAAERDLAQATAEIGVAEAELYPQLTLPGSLLFTAAGLGTGQVVQTAVASLAASLSLPLSDGGRREAALDAAEERARQALLTYRQSLLLALEEVEGALLDYDAALRRQAALREAVASDERAYDLARQLYQQGVTDFLELLDAQRSLTASQQQLVVNQTELSSRLVALYRSLGGGWDLPEPDEITEAVEARG